MCTVFIYRNKKSKWPLLLAANRDEFFKRKFIAPSTHWKKNPEIFAGKDLSKGGSWLGVNKNGLCVAVLNRDSSELKSKQLLSRGHLVIDLLKSKNIKSALSFFSKNFKKNYKFFNLILADYKDAFWVKYESKNFTINEIPFGHSMIDNYDLNSNNSNKQKIYKSDFIKSSLPNPDKKDFSSWKRLLLLNKEYNNIKTTAVFLKSINNNYGTVSSSIIGLPNKEINDNNIIWLYSDRNKDFNNLKVFSTRNDMKLLIEGKAKKIYKTKDKNILIQYFKDDATAFNNKKKQIFKDKGILNNSISSIIFDYLKKNKIKTHFIEKISDREQLIKRVNIIPLEVVVRNYSAGSFSKRFDIKKGIKIKKPLLEFYYKSDDLDDPIMNDDHILYMKITNVKELKRIKFLALKINTLLSDFFDKTGILLVDFKLEFGRYKNKILLADEISPDSCRLWDKKFKKSYDKDLFRENKGDLIKAYKKILKGLDRI